MVQEEEEGVGIGEGVDIGGVWQAGRGEMG